MPDQTSGLQRRGAIRILRTRYTPHTRLFIIYESPDGQRYQLSTAYGDISRTDTELIATATGHNYDRQEDQLILSPGETINDAVDRLAIELFLTPYALHLCAHCGA